MDRKNKIMGAVIIGIILIVGIFGGLYLFGETKEDPVQIANPASVYCVEMGGRVDVFKVEGGDMAYCILGDEECEEWAFYRGECSFSNGKKCVPDSCCHAAGCVIESEAPNCSGAICTLECRGGTMDCGAGYCGFVDGKCEVIWNE